MNDKEILQRVIPPKLQHLLFLLTSQKQPIHKSQCYFEKSLLKASQLAHATPCNLQQLANILMKSLVLPSLDEENGSLKRTPILLALSPYLRQNLILFLRRFKSRFVYDEFTDFLYLNRSKLDSWSKVILRSEKENIKQTELSRRNLIISKSSISKLASFKSKFPSISSYRLDKVSETESEYETECEVTSPPSKRRRLPSPPDNFFDEDNGIDEEQMISACDKSVAVFNKSKESSQIRSSAPDEGSKGNQSRAKDEECISEFFVDNRSVIESCKTDSSLDRLSDIISVFTRCPLLDFQNLLTVEFNTVEWDEEFVLLLFERFICEDCLSFEKMKLFVCASITQRLKRCKDAIPRSLMETISNLVKLSSRVGIIAVVCEMLLFKEFLPVHHDLITKLFASQILSPGDVNKILEDCLARAFPESWNEDLLGTLDFLVCKKTSLADNTFSLLISNLAVAAKRFEKSLKLIKLVINLVQNYESQKARFTNTLKNIVDLNETFLKKKAQALL